MDVDALEILILWQLDKILYKWLTATCSKTKSVNGPMIIEEVKSFYDYMKKADNCTITDRWL